MSQAIAELSQRQAAAPAARRWSFDWTLAIMLLAALGARIVFFPGRDQLHGDDWSYQDSSLLLFEGLTPAHKAAPAGPQIWMGWSYLMARTAIAYFAGPPEVRAVPSPSRPFTAANVALFDAYRDAWPLRRFLLACTIATSLLGVWAAYRLGQVSAGKYGGLALAGIVAFSPLFLSCSLSTRPYIMAWAFAFAGAYFGITGRTRTRRCTAWIFLGLSIASRIEMLLLLPLQWLLASIPESPLRKARWIRQCIAGTALAALVTAATAPWLITSLLTNLKTIAAVKMAVVSGVARTPLELARDLFMREGIGVALLGLLAGITLGLSSRQTRTRAIWLALICLAALLTSLKGTGYGLHHDGATIVALLIAAAIAIGPLAQRSRAAAAVVAAAAIGMSAAANAYNNDWRVPVIPFSPSTQWIEQHVPSGTRVYSRATFPRLLPTRDSADQVWTDFVTNGWRQKLEWGLTTFGVRADPADLPRALSFDNASKELAPARALFILGSRPSLPIPRYDVRVFGDDGTLLGSMANLYARSGGVLVIDGAEPPNVPGRLVASWRRPRGFSTFVFASDDVKIR